MFTALSVLLPWMQECVLENFTYLAGPNARHLTQDNSTVWVLQLVTSPTEAGEVLELMGPALRVASRVWKRSSQELYENEAFEGFVLQYT